MVRREIAWMAATAAVVAMGAAASAETLKEELHKTYPLAADGRLSLKNVNGPVRISGWDRNEVQLDAVKSARTKEALGEATIVIDSNADSISIRTRYPEQNHRRDRANVEYTLRIPRGARLFAVETVNGALNLSDLSGEIKASSVNGKVTAGKLAGPVRLSTVNGGLNASFDRLEGSKAVTLSAVNGSIALSLPHKANAEINAGTHHGSIRSDFEFAIRPAGHVSRSAIVRIGNGDARIKLSTVNGGIEILSTDGGRRVRSAD